MTLGYCLKPLTARPTGWKCGVSQQKLPGFQGLGFCSYQTGL